MGGGGGALGAGAARGDRGRELSPATPLPDGNPLTAPVLAILRQRSAGLSEYELIGELDSWWPPLASDGQLALFQKHFLVMNALYRLQAQLLAEEGLYLAISPLAIQLQPACATAEGVRTGTSDAALRDYYLDWNQLAATDRAAVDALLTGFWQRFHAVDAVAEALLTLELTSSAPWPDVVASYRRLAAQTHPDRGGDAAQFLLIRAAYEQLRLHYGR